MSDRDRERPKPQLRGPYPRQCPWMAPVKKAEDTKGNDKEARTDLYLAMPFDQRDQ